MTDHEHIPDEEWTAVVENVPIVSVDLIARWRDGVVLGKRTNEPAKGEWFVPGGRVHKNEQLVDAVDRVAREELNADVRVVERLGAYEHFYDAADVPSASGKHYVAHAFVVEADDDAALEPEAQHEEFRRFDAVPADAHEYVARYLTDAGFDEPAGDAGE